MDMENVKQELKEMLIDRLFLSLTPEEIESDKNLMDEYGIDSVSIMEMAVGLEERYGISFADGGFKLDYFKTIDSMAALVERKSS